MIDWNKVEKANNPPIKLPKDFKKPTAIDEARELLKAIQPYAVCYIIALFLYSSLLYGIELVKQILK